MNIRQFSKQGFTYSLGFIVSRLQVFLLLPILVNCLQPKEYGIYETLSTLIVLSTTICVFNLDSSISSYFHKFESTLKRQMLCSTGLLIMFLWILLLLLIVFSLKNSFTNLIFKFEVDSNFIFKSFLIGGLQGVVHYLNVLLRQKFQAVRYNVLVFMQTFPLLAVVSYFYFQNQLNLNLVLDTFILVNAGTLFVGYFLNRDLLKFSIEVSQIRPLLNIALPLLPFSIFAWALSLSDRILLTRSLGVEQVAIYAFANRIASISSVLQGPFQIAWPPYALKLLADKKENEIFFKAIRLFILATGTLILLLSFLSPTIFRLMAPVEYANAAKYVGILAFCTLLNSLYYFPLTIFLHTKNTWASTLSFFLAACVNIISNLFITPKIGISGAAYTNLASYLVLTTSAFILSNRFQNVNFQFKQNLIILMAILGIIILPFLI